MRTRLSIVILFALLPGSMPLHAASSGTAAIKPVTGWGFGLPQTVQRILRLVPKPTGGRLSPPNPAPAPLTPTPLSRVSL